MKVLITGGTGFVGSRITRKLLERGDQVNIVTRNVPKGVLKLGKKPQFFKWDPMKETLPEEALEGVDAVINLMGENISESRWNEDDKKRIYDSRVIGTRNLVETINKVGKIQSFISTSAIGVYGDRPGGEEVTEDTEVEEVDFLSKVCLDWEKASQEVNQNNVRLCVLRVGIVLGKGGGALSKMLTPFKLGVGGVIGSGKQVMSWIHIDDLVDFYLKMVDDSAYKGVVNATAPRPVTNKVFTKTLGKVLNRPTIFPVPRFAAKLAFGDMSTILLEGQKVIPHKALENSFSFKFDSLEKALRDLV